MVPELSPTVGHRRLSTMSQAADTRGEAHRADHRLDRKLGMRLAHQNHTDARLHFHQPPECPQRFRNPFVRLQVPEDPYQGHVGVQPQLLAVRVPVGPGNPRAVRNHRDGPGEPRRADLALHEAAVYDHSAGAFQQAPRHGDASVVRPHFQFPYPLGEGARRGAAVVFAFVHVGVPVAAPDGQLRNQVMEIGFVHHHHAGMA
jgi:hypothetical protein